MAHLALTVSTETIFEISLLNIVVLTFIPDAHAQNKHMIMREAREKMAILNYVDSLRYTL